MRQSYSIFVEGVADERLVGQLVEVLFDVEFPKRNLFVTNGWNALVASTSENLYINQMNRTSDNGGVNLVIFDADDDIEGRRKELLEWKAKHGVDFELFLLPNNHDNGELEDLLESIINPNNEPVMDCWKNYEDSLRQVDLPWREGEPLTIPAKKTKIYAYLEVLLGTSKSQKERIKENKRDYTNQNHWNLNADSIKNLSDFLRGNLE